MIPKRVSRTAAVALALCLSLVCVSGIDAQQQKPRPIAKPSATKPAPASTEVPKPGERERKRPATADAEAGAPIAARSAADHPALGPPTLAEIEMGYPLGVGDVVKVTVFQQQDMTTETRVSEAGTVTVPLLGPVPVGGVTAKRAEDRIAALLRARGFMLDPQVVVTVTQFKSRQVSVLGYVTRPGRYPLEEGSYYLTDVLSMAGGAIAGASDTVTLLRKGDEGIKRYEIELPRLFRGSGGDGNLQVLPGDTLFVDKAPVFYIYGEVQRPGAFRLEKDMTVMQALSVGGGLTQRGTEKNMRMTRRDAEGKLNTLAPSMSDRLQPDDVIYVRESLF